MDVCTDKKVIDSTPAEEFDKLDRGIEIEVSDESVKMVACVVKCDEMEDGF